MFALEKLPLASAGLFSWLLAMSLCHAQTPTPLPSEGGFQTVLQASREAIRSGNWTAAEERLRAGRRQFPDSVEVSVLHAEALAHVGQPFDGILELEDLLERRPTAVPALKLYGDLLETVARDHSRAEATWMKASELAPTDPEIWRALGNLYIAQQKTDGAIRCYEKAEFLTPGDPVVLAGLGYSHGQAGQNAEAEKEFGRALRLNERLRPPRATVYALYASYLRNSGRLKESVDFFSRALESDRGVWQIYYERAVAYEKLKDYSRAETDALRALELGRDRREIRLTLLRIYRGLGEEQKIREQLTAIERLNDGENQYYATARELRQDLKVAEEAIRKGDCATAAPPYEKVVALMPSFYEAWFPLGVCYSQQGRTADAEAALTKYLAFQPLSADGRTILGLLYLQTGRYKLSRDELARAVDIDPSAAEAREGLARAEFALADFPAAARELDSIISSRAGAGPALYALAAQSRSRVGEREKALELCVRGLKAFPDDIGIQNVHATLLFECRQAPACRAALVDALKGHPDSAAYLKAAAQELIDHDPSSDAAGQMIRAMLARLPDDPAARLLEARWLYLRNRYLEAAESAGKAIRMAAPSNTVRIEADTLMGQIQMALHNNGQAQQYFDEGWNLNRESTTDFDASAATAYARYLVRQQRPMEAKAILDTAVLRAPEFGEAHLERAKLTATQDAHAATEDAVLALKYSDDPELQQEAHVLLVRTYSMMGRQEEAEANDAWLRSRH